MTKKDLCMNVKNILHTNKLYEPIEDISLLHKLFRMYYNHSNKDKFSFIWDDKVMLTEIFVGYNKGEGYTSKGFQLKFSNEIIESPSFYKAIASLTKEELKTFEL